MYGTSRRHSGSSPLVEHPGANVSRFTSKWYRPPSDHQRSYAAAKDGERRGEVLRHSRRGMAEAILNALNYVMSVEAAVE
ncbi:MAG TPA: hypothetical protein VFZ73_16660 [Gemmatimonadaceae bacterium]